MIKSLVVFCLRPVGLAGITVFFRSGLREEGWFRSARERRPVDKKGQPLPWYSYPAIHFLAPRLTKQMDVFEYGAGFSSLWFAQRVSSVTSLEHNLFWFGHIQEKAPANHQVLFHPAKDVEGYVRTIAATEKKYDIVVIDAENRLECVPHAIAALKDDGVVIFDNTQTPPCEKAYSMFGAHKFRSLDFVGPLPIHHWNNTTTVFYRTHNCLGI